MLIDRETELQELHDVILEIEALICQAHKRLIFLQNNKSYISERETIFNVPVAPQIVDRIAGMKHLNTSQKTQLAKNFLGKKLDKERERAAIKNAATKMTSDELALNFINRNQPEGDKFKIVPDATTGKVRR